MGFLILKSVKWPSLGLSKGHIRAPPAWRRTSLFLSLGRERLISASVFYKGSSTMRKRSLLLEKRTENRLHSLPFLYFFFKFFFSNVDHFLSHYWICYNIASVSYVFFFCFIFFVCFCFFFEFEACEIGATQPQIEPASLALEGKVLTTGPLGKSLRFLDLRFCVFPIETVKLKLYQKARIVCIFISF